MYLSYIDPDIIPGKRADRGLSDRIVWPEKLKSHQYGAKDLKRVDAYYLQKGDQIFICGEFSR